MKKFVSSAAMVGLLVASSSSVFAKGPGGGASAVSPGQQFRSGGTPPVSGLPGASGYSPGQQMRANGGPAPGSNGASVYAPGFSGGIDLSVESKA
jgi:hypothetical protein